MHWKASSYACDRDDFCRSAGAWAMCGGEKTTCGNQSLLWAMGSDHRLSWLRLFYPLSHLNDPESGSVGFRSESGSALTLSEECAGCPQLREWSVNML